MGSLSVLLPHRCTHTHRPLLPTLLEELVLNCEAGQLITISTRAHLLDLAAGDLLGELGARVGWCGEGGYGRVVCSSEVTLQYLQASLRDRNCPSNPDWAPAISDFHEAFQCNSPLTPIRMLGTAIPSSPAMFRVNFNSVKLIWVQGDRTSLSTVIQSPQKSPPRSPSIDLCLFDL